MKLEVILAKCSAAGRFARWMEGCWCHEEARTKTQRGSAKRRKLMTEAGGIASSSGLCPWAGRRRPELVAGQMDRFLVSLRTASSSELVRLGLSDHPERTLGGAPRWQTLLSASLIEVLFVLSIKNKHNPTHNTNTTHTYTQ